MITDFRLFEAKDTTLFILIDKYPLSFFKDAILNGADINMTNTSNECVLSYAINNKKNDYVYYIIDECDDVDYESKDIQGRTPISVAAVNEELDIVKDLSKKANINTIDNHGNSLLMRALIFNSQSRMIDYLIEIVDWNIKNNNGDDLFDIMSDKYIKIFQEKYPEKYQDYLIWIDLEKFNI